MNYIREVRVEGGVIVVLRDKVAIRMSLLQFEVNVENVMRLTSLLKTIATPPPRLPSSRVLCIMWSPMFVKIEVVKVSSLFNQVLVSAVIV